MRTRRWLTGVVVLLVLLAGCADGRSATRTGPGGTLIAAIGGEPDRYDPHRTSSYFSFQVLENVFDTLVEPDRDLQMQPALATSWTVSPDQLTWTFRLRQGVRFHDGSPLRASDVVYSYRRIIDGKLANAYRFASVRGIAAPDSATVVLTLRRPTPNLLTALGGFKGMAIVQERNVVEGAINRKPIGTGPFALARVSPGESVELVANAAYWGGAPKIAGVTFRFIAEPIAALTNLRGGQIHWTDNLPLQQVARLRTDARLVVGSASSTDYWYFAANERRKPYDDVRVRQALAWAVDRDAIVKAAMFGTATANQTAIPAGSPWHVPYAPYRYDPATARRLLGEAGVSGLEMELLATGEYPETVAVAQILADAFADIGITVSIRVLDFAAWLDAQARGAFDVLMLGWLGNLDPDDYYYAQQHSGGASNYQGYADPEADRLLDAGRVEVDPARRKALYGAAAKTIVDDAGYVYLYNPDVVQAWAPRVAGYEVRDDRAIRFKNVTLG